MATYAQCVHECLPVFTRMQSFLIKPCIFRRQRGSARADGGRLFLFLPGMRLSEKRHTCDDEQHQDYGNSKRIQYGLLPGSRQNENNFDITGCEIFPITIPKACRGQVPKALRRADYLPAFFVISRSGSVPYTAEYFRALRQKAWFRRTNPVTPPRRACADGFSNIPCWGVRNSELLLLM